MAINNAPLGGVNIGVTTPAMFGAVPERYIRRYEPSTYERVDETPVVDYRASEEVRRYAEERLTGHRLGPDTNELLRQVHMENTNIWGRAFGLSEDFINPINDATTRAQIAEFERHRVQTRQVPIITPGERVGEWRIQEDGPSRRMVMMQEAEGSLPELRAVRTGFTNPVDPSIRNTFSISGTGGEMFGSASSAQKPSEDLEGLREYHGLRIEELEDQVRSLTERLERLEQSILL